MAFQNGNLLPVASSTFEGGTHTWQDQTSNTTLSVVSGQYLNGTYSLRFTATAAGSVQAYSQMVSGIVPGKTYVARIPVRVQTATAGKTFQARILFYGPDGGANIGFNNSTVTASSTATGWNSVNYPTVSMVAPAGATQARIAFIGSGLAAGEYVNIDDAYLTAVDDRYGELLDYETRSFESGVSTWTATNGTLSRVAGVLYTGAGYYVLGASTTVATGFMYLRTASLYPVTPGKTYVAYAASQATATLTGVSGLEWYTADNTWIATTSVPVTYSATITRLAVSGVAPANAAKCRPVYRVDPTAVGQNVYLDDVSLCEPMTTPAGKGPNLLTYEEWSTESTLPAWSVTGATAERAYLTSGITEGFYQLKLTPLELGSGILTASLDRLVPVTPGTTYQVGATIFRHNTDTAQVVTSAVRMFVDWYDANGNLFEADNPDQFYPVDKADEWYAQINSETRTCPEGAAFARVCMQLDSDSALVDAWYADTIYLVEADSEYDLAVNNDTGCVTLTVNYVATGASNAYVTIKRIDQDGEVASLRGYGKTWDMALNPASIIVVEDYEAPLGSRVWYSIVWSNSSGVQGARILTRSVDAPTLPDPDYVWFKSPGLPALNTRVMVEEPITWARDARMSAYSVVGRRNPVVVTDTRPGRTATVTFLVWDEASNAQFDSLLDTGLPALIQAMPGYGVDGNLYVSIGQVEVESVTGAATVPGWRWTLSVTEIDRPDGGLQGSSAGTWQTLSDAFDTWGDVLTGFGAWSGVLVDPDGNGI